jgi:hypothetical protein
MKFRSIVVCFGVAGLALRAPAAESEAQALRTQLQELRATFEKTRREQEQQIEALTRKIEALTAGAPALATKVESSEQKKLEQELAAELAPSPAKPPSNAPAERTTEGAPVARAGSTYMNISYGTLIDAGWSSVPNPGAQLELGDHDPSKRGFSLRNAEIAVDGAVDPYFKGFANIVLKLDANNETSIELEESFVQSTALPANLQLKAGQYFAAFGRQNQQHPHAWAFVDQPLILSRAFGPDGLRSIGAQLSWLAPTPFYSEVFLSVLDGQGGTAFSFRNPGEPDAAGVERYAGRATVTRSLRGAQDLVFVPRAAASFEVSDTQTLLVGVSGAFGPNSTGPANRTEIYGADAFWKWKPADATGGFPFVSWQTEGLYRRFSAAADTGVPVPLPAEKLRDYGFYSQLVWGFAPRWQAGLRGEYVNGNTAVFDANDPFRGRRTRVSPQLTFLPSEFSKLRFQYNYDRGEFIGSANSIWLQLEFGLGAHAAHKF